MSLTSFLRDVWRTYPAGVAYVATVLGAPLVGLLLFALLRP